MRHRAIFATLAVLTTFSLIICTVGQQAPAQNSPPQSQPQKTEKPPHADVERNPEARDIERSILDALHQDPHMAYSRVRVHVTGKRVVLSGVVLTSGARDQAEQIASNHALGRKVTNKIRVNSNIHPGSGL